MASRSFVGSSSESHVNEGIYQFDSNIAISKVTNWIIDSDLAITEVEESSFNEFVSYLQPSWEKISRHQVKNEVKRLHQESKEILRAIFASTNGRFGLTCDDWKTLTRDYYICITCYWIDSDWILQKRIIGFKRFESPDNTAHIAGIINAVCHEFQILNKVFCISFDNDSNNINVIPTLRHAMNPILDGEFFHNRCASHILNLCIQDDLKNMEETILKPIREIISFIRTSAIRYQEFKQLCQASGVSFKKFKMECITKCNFTWDMLSSIITFKQQLIEFALINNLELDFYILEKVEIFVEFFTGFKSATELLSWSYNPTMHHMIPTITRLLKMITRFMKNPYFVPTCVDMIEKFKTYYECIPFLYSIALILDPRAKLVGLEFMLKTIYKVLYASDSSHVISNKLCEYKRELEIILQRTFSLYHQEYMTNKGAEESARSEANIANESSYHEYDPFLDIELSDPVRNDQRPLYDELTIYQASPRVKYVPGAPFDILNWWKERSNTYPVLALMARDFLCTPTSTVASGSVFNLSGRMLGERHSRLAPATLEMITCLRDWNRAAQRTQDTVNNWIHEEDEDNDISIT